MKIGEILPVLESRTRWGNGSVTITFGDNIMYDEGARERLSHYLQVKNYIEGTDFMWDIAMGDDTPHAITINNGRMLADRRIISFLKNFEGNSPY